MDNYYRINSTHYLGITIWDDAYTDGSIEMYNNDGALTQEWNITVPAFITDDWSLIEHLDWEYGIDVEDIAECDEKGQNYDD